MAPIQAAEIAEAIGVLTLNKSPGTMALLQSFIFLKTIQISVITISADFFSAFVEKKKLLPTWNQATSMLSLKPDWDISVPQSYRPISLLNIYY